MSELRDYCFCSTWDGDGEIYNREGAIVWRFLTTGVRDHAVAVEPQLPSVFAFYDEGKRELLTIRRERRFPMARFKIIENGLLAGTIRQESPVFTRYALEFPNGSNWKLYLPMFSVSIRGVSDAGGEILARFRMRRQWYVRLGAGMDTPPMMAALAYIIRKKLQRT